MSALPIEAAPPVALPTTRSGILALARSYGPLRAVTPEQAPVIRAATEYNRHYRPRWQRFGDGVREQPEETVKPVDYVTGLTYQRGPAERVIGAKGVGWRGTRVAVRTGTPHTNWRTRQHWLDVVVPAAINARPEALQTHRGVVSAKRLLTWATEISKFAHPSTGRHCIVRPADLAKLMGVNKSTVQRCQAAAEALGLYVVMLPGRMLDRDDSMGARKRGSYQRGLANEAALVIPGHLDSETVAAPLPVDNAARRRHLAAVPAPGKRQNDTPTSGTCSTPRNLTLGSSLGGHERCAGGQEPTSSAGRNKSEAGNLDGEGRSRPRNGSEAVEVAPRRPRKRVYDADALDLARALVARLSWLAGIQPGRLEPMLRRFVRCDLPWTAEDVVRAIDTANAANGRASMTRSHVKAPVGLLAKYLRELDYVLDHPRFTSKAAHVAPVRKESARQIENRLLLEAHRQGAGAGQRPEVKAAALGQIRDELAARRALRDNQG